MCLSIYLSIYLSVCLSIYLSIHLSIYMCVCITYTYTCSSIPVLASSSTMINVASLSPCKMLLPEIVILKERFIRPCNVCTREHVFAHYCSSICLHMNICTCTYAYVHILTHMFARTHIKCFPKTFAHLNAYKFLFSRL